MNLAQVHKLIKKALRDAENEALEEGLDVTTEEFKATLAAARDTILSNLKVEPSEYDAYLENLKEASREKRAAKEAELEQRFSDIVSGTDEKIAAIKIPTQDEITEIAKSTVHQFSQPPQIINQIVKETTIEKPIKETVTITKQEKYDDSKLRKELTTVREEIKAFKSQAPVDMNDFKEGMMKEVGDLFAPKEAVFKVSSQAIESVRNLGSGLQEQIEDIDDVHVIQDEGVSLPFRQNLNFVGSSVTVTDDPSNNATKVTVSDVDTDTGITQLTGDATAGPGSGSQALTLATVNGNVGSFTVSNITVNGKGLVTAASDGLTLASGVYTPTLTIVANVDGGGLTAYQCQYMRVGSVVNVSGKLDVNPTLAATLTQAGISLPIASNIGAAEDCGGVAFTPTVAGQGAAIYGDLTNNRAQLEFVAGAATSQPMYFDFQYRII